MLAILLIGEDLRLLATRAAVLRKVDAEVDLGRPAEFTTRMRARRYDLLVLCHTLQEKDAEAITSQVQQSWPEVRILQIVREQWMEAPVRRGVTSLSTSDPKRLVERARELLPMTAGGA
jgi:hypothetical protein